MAGLWDIGFGNGVTEWRGRGGKRQPSALTWYNAPSPQCVVWPRKTTRRYPWERCFTS